MSFETCGGVVHYYRYHGSGGARVAGRDEPPLLVFINGLGTSHQIWEGVLEALPPDLPALIYDQRGQGLSELGDGQHDLAALSDDLRALLDRIGARSVVLCGFSFGGLVAQRFTLAYPERVRGLCLCASAPRIGNAELWRERARRVQSEGLPALAPSLVERWFSPAFLAAEPGLVRGQCVALERASVPGYLSTLALLAASDLSAESSQISVPLLVVAGEIDVAVPLEQLRAWTAALPGARLRVLSGAAHLIPVERPAALVAALLEFFGTLEPAPEAGGDARLDAVWQRGLAMRRAVLGPAHVERSLAHATEFDRDFQEYITRAAWGEIWTRPGLAISTRHLLTIALLAALNRPEELALHLEATSNTGVSPQELKEALMHVAVYAGVPAANAAMRTAKKLLADRARAAQSSDPGGSRPRALSSTSTAGSEGTDERR